MTLERVHTCSRLYIPDLDGAVIMMPIRLELESATKATEFAPVAMALERVRTCGRLMPCPDLERCGRSMPIRPGPNQARRQPSYPGRYDPQACARMWPSLRLIPDLDGTIVRCRYD